MPGVLIDQPDAEVRVEDRDGRRAISVKMKNGRFTPASAWTTDYPLDLIEHVLAVKGAAYLCDEIMRDENRASVQHSLSWDILSYVGEEEFAGKRMLDFGSGSGASSMVLARMLPHAQIVGVELVPKLLELAEHRARYYRVGERASRSSSRPILTAYPWRLASSTTSFSPPCSSICCPASGKSFCRCSGRP